MNFEEWVSIAILSIWLMGLLLMFIILIDLATGLYIRFKRDVKELK